MKNKPMIDRIGEVNYNNFGSKMTIIHYKDANNIIVEFDNGYIIKTRYSHFTEGILSNPYDKSVLGIGYIGEGGYDKKNYYSVYSIWRNMLMRTYDLKYQEKQPTYIKCSVCTEWLNFNIFSLWYNENYYEIEGYKMGLDKDILVKGNKIYSPETCVFVPQFINNLFTKRQNYRGEYPIGVTYNKISKKYISRCCDVVNNRKSLGTFTTPEEAFKIYKEEKEKYIKEVAEEYKDRIPLKLYEALYKYEVDITD